MNILFVIKVKSLMLVKWSCRSPHYVDLNIWFILNFCVQMWNHIIGIVHQTK